MNTFHVVNAFHIVSAYHSRPYARVYARVVMGGAVELFAGEGLIRRPIGGLGFYARVAVTMTVLDGAEPSVLVLDPLDEPWRVAVAFGVRYALDRRSEKRHFRVSASLHTMVGDSTQAVVAAAAARAVHAALGLGTWPLPEVDDQTRRITFP